jgi:hypothetical protein
MGRSRGSGRLAAMAVHNVRTRFAWSRPVADSAPVIQFFRYYILRNDNHIGYHFEAFAYSISRSHPSQSHAEPSNLYEGLEQRTACIKRVERVASGGLHFGYVQGPWLPGPGLILAFEQSQRACLPYIRARTGIRTL